MLPRQIDDASPPDKLGIDRLDKIGLWLVAQASVLIVELINRCRAPCNVLRSRSIAAGDKESMTVRRPRHPQPRRLEFDVLNLLLRLRIDNHDAVRQIARVTRDDDPSI